MPNVGGEKIWGKIIYQVKHKPQEIWYCSITSKQSRLQWMENTIRDTEENAIMKFPINMENKINLNMYIPNNTIT